MCFTVAILRKDVLMTTEEYYRSLPPVRKKNDYPAMPEFPDSFMVSGFVHPQLPVIKEEGIELYEWGLIPEWIKDTASATELRTKTLNAKGETIFEKPSFRRNILSHRCLLPVRGFYEWRELNGTKYPYYIQSEAGSGFLLGSVYDSWTNRSTGEIRNTFSIVTTAANPLMEMIQNIKKRMPLILSNSEAQVWLDPDITSVQIQQLIKPFDERLMKAHTISRAANNPQTNRNFPEIMQRVDYTELNQQSLF